MKTALLTFLSLSLALAAQAASTIVPIPYSQEPRATVVNTNDDVIMNATNAGTGTWTTKRATVGKVSDAVASLILPQVPGRTNPVFYNSLVGASVTDSNVTLNGQTSSLWDFVSGTNYGTRIFFSQTPGDSAFGNLYVNPYHSGSFSPATTEWQICSPGHIAVSPGSGTANGGHIQIGIGGAASLSNTNNGAYWVYLQDAGPKWTTFGTETKTMFSAPLTARVDGYFSGVSGTVRTFFPGIIGQYRTVTTDTSSLGLYEFDIFADLGNSSNGLGWGDNYSPATIRHQIQNFSGDHQGSKVSGGAMANWTNAAPGASYALDFADSYARVLTPSVNTVTWSTTNTLAAVAGGNTYAKAVYIVKGGGLIITNVWPSGWNTNGNGLPATIPAGKFMRLALEWFSPGGETNVNVESASLFADSTYIVDADATAFSTSAGLTGSAAAAINTFVLSLKADGTWTNFDAIYPFCSSMASNGFNLVSHATYQIGWSNAASFTTNGPGGIQSSGHGATMGGFGNTGWNPSALHGGNSGMFVWIKSDASTGDWSTVAGAGTNSTGIGYFKLGHPQSAYWIAYYNSYTPPNESQTLDPAVLGFPQGVFVGRTGANTYQVFMGTVGQSGAAGDFCTVGNCPVYLCAYNLNNAAAQWWGGIMQVAALGRGDLSASQNTTLYNAVQALNTALGR